jgi:hypothetical protein
MPQKISTERPSCSTDTMLLQQKQQQQQIPSSLGDYNGQPQLLQMGQKLLPAHKHPQLTQQQYGP